MRYLLVTFLAMLLVSTSLIAGETSHGGIRGFHKWAANESENMDRTWENITSSADSPSPVSRTAERLESRSAAPRGWSSSSGKVTTVWRYSPSTYTGSSNPEFLPRSTRERRDPSRGNFKIKHPARVRLSSANRFRRTPFKGISSKNFFQRGRSISRPRLSSASRSGRGHRSRGTPTRPASHYRISRPSRRFSW